jgi:hypothetical protein
MLLGLLKLWSIPLGGRDYKSVYGRLARLPQGSPIVLADAVWKHYKRDGLVPTARRFLNVLKEWLNLLAEGVSRKR